MDRNIKYELLIGNTVSELSDEVNNRLQRGYKLYGGNSSFCDDKTNYHTQAVILKG